MHVCLPIGYCEWENDDIAGQCGSPGILAGEHFGEHIKVGLSVRMQRDWGYARVHGNPVALCITERMRRLRL